MLFIFVVTDGASSVGGLWSAASPVISLVHIIMISPVGLEILDHALPSSILRPPTLDAPSVTTKIKSMVILALKKW
jgi:hypothetical protein